MRDILLVILLRCAAFFGRFCISLYATEMRNGEVTGLREICTTSLVRACLLISAHGFHISYHLYFHKIEAKNFAVLSYRKQPLTRSLLETLLRLFFPSPYIFDTYVHQFLVFNRSCSARCFFFSFFLVEHNYFYFENSRTFSSLHFSEFWSERSMDHWKCEQNSEREMPKFLIPVESMFFVQKSQRR